MPYKLSSNHFFILAEQDMRTICNSLLGDHGVTYCCYLRIYDNRSCTILATDTRLMQYVFENDVPQGAPIESRLITEQFNYFILPANSTYQKFLEDAKNYFN